MYVLRIHLFSRRRRRLQFVCMDFSLLEFLLQQFRILLLLSFIIFKETIIKLLTK